MLDQILKRVVVDPEVDAAFAAIPNKVNELGYDAWRFHPEKAKILFSLGKRIFNYFHPQITGIEHLPEKNWQKERNVSILFHLSIIA